VRQKKHSTDMGARIRCASEGWPPDAPKSNSGRGY